MRYFVYSLPGQKAKGTLNTTESPESIQSRFRFGEYNLIQVSYGRYLEVLRASFKGG